MRKNNRFGQDPAVRHTPYHRYLSACPARRRRRLAAVHASADRRRHRQPAAGASPTAHAAFRFQTRPTRPRHQHLQSYYELAPKLRIRRRTHRSSAPSPGTSPSAAAEVTEPSAWRHPQTASPGRAESIGLRCVEPGRWSCLGSGPIGRFAQALQAHVKAKLSSSDPVRPEAIAGTTHFRARMALRRGARAWMRPCIR